MKTKVAELFMKVAMKTKAEAPVLFAGAAIIGVGLTIIQTMKATQLAIEDLEQECIEIGMPKGSWKEGLSLGGKAQRTWKRFIPVVLTGGLTIGCIFAGQYISIRRTATVAALYAAAEDKLQKYQEATKEVIGEKKEKEVRGAMAQKYVNDQPMEDGDVAIIPGGHHLILDAYTGRYFRSDIETIRQKANDLNRDLRTTMWASYSDWYDVLELKSYKGYSDIGWSCDSGIDVVFDAAVADNGEPCIVMDYCVGPTSDFKNYR